jgi:hypothetical protein
VAAFDQNAFSQSAFSIAAFDFGEEEPGAGTSPVPWGRGPTRKQVHDHLRRREEDALFMTGII